jgi:hypothetical protein
MIVLSGNPISDKSLDFVIPNHLKGIVIDKVTFINPTLLFFLFRQLPSNSFLSVCDCTIPDSWDTLVIGKEIISSQIVSLKWDGSPIGPSFFELLTQFTQLKTLSLSRCLSMINPQMIDRFAHFVCDCRSLMRLILRGDAKQSFGSALPGFLERIQNAQHLREFDFSGHAYGGDSTPFRKFVSTMNRLRLLIIDGSLRPSEALSF